MNIDKIRLTAEDINEAIDNWSEVHEGEDLLCNMIANTATDKAIKAIQDDLYYIIGDTVGKDFKQGVWLAEALHPLVEALKEMIK